MKNLILGWWGIECEELNARSYYWVTNNLSSLWSCVWNGSIFVWPTRSWSGGHSTAWHGTTMMTNPPVTSIFFFLIKEKSYWSDFSHFSLSLLSKIPIQIFLKCCYFWIIDRLDNLWSTKKIYLYKFEPLYHNILIKFDEYLMV